MTDVDWSANLVFTPTNRVLYLQLELLPIGVEAERCTHSRLNIYIYIYIYIGVCMYACHQVMKIDFAFDLANNEPLNALAILHF